MSIELGDAPVLEVSNTSKKYGVVQALNDTSLTLRAGEIHGLVGENGCGKSTLVGVISGTVRPDTGSITVGGVPLVPGSPRRSQRSGVVTVFQDGSLVPGLSVGSNMFIGTPEGLRPRYGEMVEWSRNLLATYGLAHIDPETLAAAVPPGDQQLIEIVRAVAANPRLLVLDEATSALDSSGVDRVLAFIQDSAAKGAAVLLVTHRLAEVFRVAQQITVLRDGIQRGTMSASDTDYRGLVELMAGSSVELEFPERFDIPSDAPVLLEASGLIGRNFGPIDLTVRVGEILGIAGADGNGQRQLIRGLAAVGSPNGELTTMGTHLLSYREAVRNGVLFLSGDRRQESLFQSLSIRENLTVGILKRISKGGFIRTARERKAIDHEIQSFGIKVGSPALPITSLSGGNQQKVALSRALATNPKVILIEEPTQGVDVRSRMDIYRTLRRAADEGVGVVIESSDAGELAGLSDRIVVMSRGQITHEISGIGSTEERIVESFAVASAFESIGAREAGLSPRDGARRLKNLLSGAEDFVRLGLLTLIVLTIWIAAIFIEPNFGSAINLYNVLLLALPIVALAVAQFCVLLLGGIDVSVGSVVSLTVVVMSFFITEGGLWFMLLLSLAIAIVIGLVIGGINALLTEGTKLSPVIATITTLGIASGLALLLRPTASGLINFDLMTLMTQKVGFIPLPFLIIVPLLIVGDILLWRSRFGLIVRATGLEPKFAARLGLDVRRMKILSYLACSIIAAFAGILVAGQVGTGDGTVGAGYTLLAIAAPVLGGASLLGGRGSFVGCLVGALMLALATAIVPALKLSDAVSFLIIGGLTLAALLAYSSGGGAFRRRRSRSVRA